MGVKLDRFTIALLVLRPDAPRLAEQEANALQDAHLSHLADLHQAGQLLAAGPVLDPELRGLNIMKGIPDEARSLLDQDPAVRIGRFSVKTIEWLVPSGAVQFSRAQFPRSVADVER